MQPPDVYHLCKLPMQQLQRSWRRAHASVRRPDQSEDVVHSKNTLQSRRCALTHCHLQNEMPALQQLEQLSLEMEQIVHACPQLAER